MKLLQLTFFISAILASQNNCNKNREDQDEHSYNCLEVFIPSSLLSWARDIQSLPTTFYTKGIYDAQESMRCPLSSPHTCTRGECGDGEGIVTLSDRSSMEGRWEGGLLEGQGIITYSDNSVLTGYFLHGCLHGQVTLQEEDGTLLVGRYRQGELARGPVWLLHPAGEGAMYVDHVQWVGRLSRAVFTGDRVAWVYPDFTTGLVGQAVGGTMLQAKEAIVKQTGMENGIPRVDVSTVPGNLETYKFDPSTDTHLSSFPLQRDPYERKLLDVTTSNIPGAGVGVFTIKPLEKNRIIGYFNGIHRHRGEVFKNSDKSPYLVEGTHPNEMLDIPEEYQSWQDYHGSAGHLINHGQEGNVDYTDCWHPRFGRILCVQTLRDLETGTELLVKYDVAVDTDGLKFALKTALQLGHVVSGKSKDQFAKDVKPYLKIVGDIVKSFKMSDLVKF